MEPAVADVKMFPISEPARPSSSLSDKSSSDGRDQALRTSAIPLPEANLRNRKADSDDSQKQSATLKDTSSSKHESTSVNAFDNSQPPNPDLVLLFNTPKADASSQERTAAQTEYARLIKELNDTGLLTSTAPAAEGSQQRIIFIKGVQSAVRAEAQKER